MVSYPRRLQSGHITCYLNRTYHVLTTKFYRQLTKSGDYAHHAGQCSEMAISGASPNWHDTNVTRVYNYFRGTVERVSTPYQNDHIDWNEGRVREGYADVPLRPTYAPVHQPAEPVGKPAGRRERLSIPAEERLGSLIAAAGTAWTTYTATVDYAALWRMQILPPGPVEVCALGILVWLHAKWRRSSRAN